MPNNCSTLIQRKHNILHKILRTNSEGKLQNVLTETTAELCVSGTGKTLVHSPSTHLQATSSANRQSNALTSNRIQLSTSHLYHTYLPSIGDTDDNAERRNQIHDEVRSHSPLKKPLTNTSPKNSARPLSNSVSSIFNALEKPSTEYFTNTHDNREEIVNPSAVPHSRQSQRVIYGNGTNQNVAKQVIMSQKQSGDSGVDIRFSSSSGDTNQQQRGFAVLNRFQTKKPQLTLEPPCVQEIATKERTTPGQLYQRRQGNTIKTLNKKKIDKYRRRSEEVAQAMNGANSGLSTADRTLVPSPMARSKKSSPSSMTVHRISSDAEKKSGLNNLVLSIETNPVPIHRQPQSQYSLYRNKSPRLSSNHEQINSKIFTSNSPTPPLRLRRNHRRSQPIPSANSPHYSTNNMNSQHSLKHSMKSSSGNLYLAFIASRNFSAIEDNPFKYDIDSYKLFQIFTWLKDVEDHRHEQIDHDQLLNKQNEHLHNQEEDLALYAEVQYAVDELPVNNGSQPCEKIKTMQFDDK